MPVRRTRPDDTFSETPLLTGATQSQVMSLQNHKSEGTRSRIIKCKNTAAVSPTLLHFIGISISSEKRMGF